MNNTWKAAVYLSVGLAVVYSAMALTVGIPIAVAYTIDRVYSPDTIEMYLLGMVNGLVIWAAVDFLGDRNET